MQKLKTLLEKIKAKMTLKNLVSGTIQLSIYITIFMTITWWQQKDMLSASGDTQAPALHLVDMAGNTHNLNFNESDQPTLIYFFAPWCQVCHASIDNLEEIYQDAKENKQQISIYLVALDWSNTEEILDFLSQHQLSMPVLLGTNQTRSEYKIKGYPSYYLIDSKGKVASKSFGYSTELGLRVRVILNAQP